MHLFRFVPDLSRVPGTDFRPGATGGEFIIRAAAPPAQRVVLPARLVFATATGGPVVLGIGSRTEVVDDGSYVVVNDTDPLLVHPAPESRGSLLAVGLSGRSGPAGIPLAVFDDVRGHDASVSPILLGIGQALDGGATIARKWAEERCAALFEAVRRRDAQTREHLAHLPKQRESTRDDLFRRVQRARGFMDSRFGEIRTVGHAARVACMSEAHFHRCFAQITGVTPHRYVTERRLARALRALRETTTPICHLSQELGFVSQCTLTALFRRRFGITPADYRAGQEIPEMLTAPASLLAAFPRRPARSGNQLAA